MSGQVNCVIQRAWPSAYAIGFAASWMRSRHLAEIHCVALHDRGIAAVREAEEAVELRGPRGVGRGGVVAVVDEATVADRLHVRPGELRDPAGVAVGVCHRLRGIVDEIETFRGDPLCSAA